MALRASDDTEFNDALRARGILPPKPSSSPSPSPPPLPATDPPSRLHAASSSDSLTLESLEDELPSSTLESWRASRASELRRRDEVMRGQGVRGGGVKPIGREDYVHEVNEASEKDLPDYAEGEGDRQAGTGVVLCLHDPAPLSQHLLKLLQKLAERWPVTRFLSIPGASCIPNYPAQNHPTLICYRKGRCVRQIVGMGREDGREGGLRGLKSTADDVEGVLMDCGVLDADLKNEVAQFDEGVRGVDGQEGVDKDSDWDDTGVEDSRRPRKTILNGSRGKGYVGRRAAEDDDSGSDLDI